MMGGEVMLFSICDTCDRGKKIVIRPQLCGRPEFGSVREEKFPFWDGEGGL